MTRRALIASGSLAAAQAAARRLAITSVRAVPFRLLDPSRFGNKQFTGDHDPARWRWFGPFSQLAGSILVEIKTAVGVVGYGMGGGGGAACYIIENHLKDLLIGANALNVELLWDQLFSSTSFYGRKGVAIMAISGIDLALWDIAGKAAGMPCWQLLGGKRQQRVRSYFTGPDVEMGLKLGFTAFKQPINHGPADGEEGKRAIEAQIKQARTKIGPEPLLMIDCFARWMP